MKRCLLVIGLACMTSAGLTAVSAPAAGSERECVILLHGLARTGRSMAKLAAFLDRQGYRTVNIDYPSRTRPVDILAETVLPEAVRQCAGACKIHFVTHSMGGIMVRYYLARHRVPRLGRVVMLSPPNQGSEVVDRLKNNPVFRWLNGPAGRQLGTDARSIPNTIGPPDYDVGIITGDRTINPILSLMIPGPDDGKVSVKSAQLDGMKDFLIVHRTHPLIMNAPRVMEQTARFLKTGCFDTSLRQPALSPLSEAIRADRDTP